MKREMNQGHSIRREPRTPYFEGRLTKTKLMELPEWGLLQSNITHEDDPSPAVEVILGSVETREALWIQLREQCLTGTKFRLFLDAGEYDSHMAERKAALLRDLFNKER